MADTPALCPDRYTVQRDRCLVYASRLGPVDVFAIIPPSRSVFGGLCTHASMTAIASDRDACNANHNICLRGKRRRHTPAIKEKGFLINFIDIIVFSSLFEHKGLVRTQLV